MRELPLTAKVCMTLLCHTEHCLSSPPLEACMQPCGTMKASLKEDNFMSEQGQDLPGLPDKAKPMSKAYGVLQQQGLNFNVQEATKGSSNSPCWGVSCITLFNYPEIIGTSVI